METTPELLKTPISNKNLLMKVLLINYQFYNKIFIFYLNK